MKCFTLFAVVVSSMIFSSSASAGLVAYWDFEEGSGATTLDQINGNNDPLTDTTWVTSDLPAALSGTTAALQFNGGSSVVDTVFDGVGGNTARSIALWIKTSATNRQILVGYGSRDSGAAGTGAKWHIRIHNGAARTETKVGYILGRTNMPDG